MKFITNCDMGSVKVFSDTMSAFFSNGVGDCPTRVEIYPRKNTHKNKWPESEFLGHFTVKEKNTVHLSYYDCSDDAIYTFGVGRWFVYRPKDRVLLMYRIDGDIHA